VEIASLVSLIKLVNTACDLAFCLQVARWAAFYEHRLQEGSKAIFHIEAYVAKVMAIYKAWALTAFG
jgi:hypothetical protein